MRNKRLSKKEIIEYFREIRDINTNIFNESLQKKYDLVLFIAGISFGLISGILGNFIYNIILSKYGMYSCCIFNILIIIFLIVISILFYFVYKSYKEVRENRDRYYQSEAAYQTLHLNKDLYKQAYRLLNKNKYYKSSKRRF